MADPVITLDVGGTMFRTRKSTLVRGSGYFRALWKGGFSEASRGLDEEPAETKDTKDKEIVFLDLEPAMFQLALNKMRYPETIFPKHPHEHLRPTLDFLGMDWDVPPPPPPAPIPPPPLITLLRQGDRCERRFMGTWFKATFHEYNRNTKIISCHCDVDPSYSPTIMSLDFFKRDEQDCFRLLPDNPKNAEILARKPDPVLLRALD